MSSNKKSIVIIGTGALACLFAVRLSAVARVHLVGSWQPQIDSINEHGITIVSLDGSATVTRVAASAFSCLPDNITADFAIVLVKSYQTTAAIERVRLIAKKDTTVVTLQNGLGNLERITDGLPELHVSAGITMQGANITGLSHVTHAGNGATIVADDPALQQLVELLNIAGIPTETPAGVTRSVDAVLWRKLIINTAVNPITALTGQCNGFLADNKLARQLSEATALESFAVARAEGVWENHIATHTTGDAAEWVTEAARVTAENRSSMLQDISRGGRTEIEAMCGEVVARAKKYSCAVPLNTLWLQLVQKAEKNAGGSRGLPLYQIDELANLAGLQA